MKKIRLRSHKGIKVSTKISITVIFLFMCVYYFINYCGKKVMPTIMKEAEMDARKMAILVIKNSLNDDVLSILDENMYEVIQNNEGQIQTIDFNSKVVNKFLTKTTSVVSNNLKNIEKGNVKSMSFMDSYDAKTLKNGVISKVPMGIVTDNPLLANIGPKVPVKISMIGNVVSSVKTNISNYGINSALVEVIAKIEVEEKVIIPFQIKTIKIVNEVPVAIKIINGSVPEYFGSGKLTESSSILTIPIENE